MSDFVLNIHLFDSTYHQLYTSVPVNMNLVLPDYLYDDRTPLGADTYELKGKSVNHLRQVEAHYAVTTAMVAAVKLSYLLSPPMSASAMQSLPMFGSIPTWNIYTPPPSPGLLGLRALINHSDDPWGRSLTSYGEWNMSPTSEPECKCDIRMLMSAEHPAGCPWMIWKKSQPKVDKK